MNLQTANKKELIRKAKTFFQGKNWNKVLVFLNFVVLAFVFWLIQYYQETYEIEMTVPIQYQNVPTDIVLNKSIPNNLNIKISDKGTVLLGYKFNKKMNKISLNLKDIDKNSTFELIDQTVLSMAIRNHLAGTTSLKSFYPDNIVVDYLPLMSKELPIVLSGTINPAVGYVFTDSITLNPATVTVSGDSVALDKLHYIETEEVDYPAVNKKISTQIKLIVPEDVNLSYEKTNLDVEVEEYTEKVFYVPVQCLNIPENVNVRFFPSEVEVVCYLALSQYSLLQADDLSILIRYEDLENITNKSIGLNLSQKPEYIINYRLVPDKTDFLIEK